MLPERETQARNDLIDMEIAVLKAWKKVQEGRDELVGESTKKTQIRWLYLAVGVVALLFAGIVYGWSILKAPLATDFGWSVSDLALNFTLTMCFFCLGGTAGGLLSKRLGTRLMLFISGALAGLGFFLTARLSGESVIMLYLSYGLLAGLGIGMAYNITISTIGAWFPDKKGLCSGALMMGFGASSLVVGTVAGKLIGAPSVGWRATFAVLGVCLGVVLVVAGLILRAPGPDVELPQAVSKAAGSEERLGYRDYTPAEMLRRGTFWRAFICIVFLAAVGNTVISFAKDLSLSVGASAELSTTLVGVLSVCNGLGRILTGALFDKLGRRKTMLLANAITIAAAGVILLSVLMQSLSLCILGLCMTGVSYGSCPTTSSVLISSFYGSKHFPVNFSIMNFNLMGASFMATASSMLLTSTGGYVAPFLTLLALSLVALCLNFTIRNP